MATQLLLTVIIVKNVQTFAVLSITLQRGSPLTYSLLLGFIGLLQKFQNLISINKQVDQQSTMYTQLSAVPLENDCNGLTSVINCIHIPRRKNMTLYIMHCKAEAFNHIILMPLGSERQLINK
uniref:Uncharacterized protein n=1 Tax=Glossina palpalis gambiensis TaxID=67801 RepID=A0A1B0BVW1_9MUSC